VPQFKGSPVHNFDFFDRILTSPRLTFAGIMRKGRAHDVGGGQADKDGIDLLSKGHIIVMAICTGLIVANIYYCQPLIVLISKGFNLPESKVGSIAFFTQAGYALGLLFFVPLGDKVERKKQILWMTACTVAALIFAALSPNLLSLQIASLLIGATSIIPQLILPLAAHLASPTRTGKVIGVIMSGLLIGILLSRTLSGFIGVWLGWRGMFWVAAALSFIMLLVMRLTFPVSQPGFKGSYASLMRSLASLVREQPLLREAALISALAFSTFGMFWTTMVLHLSGSPFNFQSNLIGLFGLAAAAGALAAPLVGGSADKRNPRIPIGYGIGLLFVSFILFYIWNDSVIGLIAGIILLDLAMQCIHVSNQSRIYALLPGARNRLNTVYMTVSFMGTSLGSAIGLIVWDRANWKGVCIAGMILGAAAFLVYAATYKGFKSQAASFKS
jgi:predicted MFS family arabinose efflux permease